MFRADCPRCGPVLMWEQRITSIDNGPEGIRVHYVCTCGAPGELLTGRRRSEGREMSVRSGA